MVTHINFTLRNHPFSRHLLDQWYAFKQSQNFDCVNPIKISFDENLVDGAVNIWFERMPEIYNATMEQYDYIFLCNNAESLMVGTPLMKQMLERKNVYLICDSTLTIDHSLYDKILRYGYDSLRCNDYWTRSFYPQFYQNMANTKNKKTKILSCVNGQNRTWRKFVFDEIKKRLPDLLIKGTYDAPIPITLDSQWESEEDTIFRDWVNDLYQQIAIDNVSHEYYNQGKTVGIDGKFGEMLPGHFIIDEYWDSKCVIYPETTWQNDELIITEKTYKCFYAKTFPFIIGGSNVNRLCNERGFYTAWNLLPEHLKSYDAIKNHRARYLAMIDAVVWLHENDKIFENPDSIEMLNINKDKFLHNESDHEMIIAFDSFFTKLLK